MDFAPIFDWAINFYSQYPQFCYIVGGILLVLVLWKPAKVLKNALLLLVLLLVVYVAFYMVDSMNFGKKIKEEAIHRTEKAIE